MITVYGIPNCDTVKKARVWLDQHGISYEFHDFKKKGLDETVLGDWLARFGWQGIVNTRGTTWKKLGLSAEAMSDNNPGPVIGQNLSLIKRPVLVKGDSVIMGYQDVAWRALLGLDATGKPTNGPDEHPNN